MKSIKYVEILIVCLLSFTSFSCSALPNQWMPQWKVGDWWIIKGRSNVTLASIAKEPRDINTIPPARVYYKVIGTEMINGYECFSVEQRGLPIDEYRPETQIIFSFRKDNLQIVRITYCGYTKGKVTKASHNFKYNYKIPFVSHNPVFDIFPSFPLVYKGAEAESLALKRSDPNQAMVSQIVSVRRIEEFNKMIMSTDTIYTSEGDCYYVLLETWADTSRLRSETKAIWIPSLPWFLYSETSIIENGKMKPLMQRWLADYSGWHKNEK